MEEIGWLTLIWADYPFGLSDSSLVTEIRAAKCCQTLSLKQAHFSPLKNKNKTL